MRRAAGEHYARTDSGELIGPYDSVAECEAERVASNVEDAAIDAALCDCQLWGNLPESAREFYRREAREGLA